MPDSTSLLPVPAKREASPAALMSSASELRATAPLEQLEPNVDTQKATSAAPFTKPKPESRLNLVKRTVPPTSKRAAPVSYPSAALPDTKRPATHARTKSTSTTIGRPGPVATRPSSVTGIRADVPSTKRPSVGSRPASAATTRPSSVTGLRSSQGPPVIKPIRRATDAKGRIDELESAFTTMKQEQLAQASRTSTENLAIAAELASERQKLIDLASERQNLQLQFDLANEQIGRLTGEVHLASLQRAQLDNRHAIELDNVRAESVCKVREIESEVFERERQIGRVQADAEAMRRSLEMDIADKIRELSTASSRIQELVGQLDVQSRGRLALEGKLAEQSTDSMTLQQTIGGLEARINVMEAQALAMQETITAHIQALAESNKEKAELRANLISEETQRRVLHNRIQELKGNIRVFCRVRPALPHEPLADSIRISDTPDEVEVVSSSTEMSLYGKEDKTYNFGFDKVFAPKAQNADVFAEISQLVQSALDGYNVAIFAYGQTGSGKTHTMSSQDGMIPRAVEQIYKAATDLQSKGWEYTIEGSFLEIYCENMRDLLSTKSATGKLDIRHDEKRKTTIVDGLTTVSLDSASRVDSLLALAAKNRTTAATAANERSSRSHSVFMLALEGKNEGTGERSRGVLNLVDLAGSERLNHSQAVGDRLKETQAINKSLACLADVIHALGNDSAHVPYRNSKLTYLLQYSLGGNSKTLMFVNISPAKEHVSETLCSLRFATAVNKTIVGTAKSSKR